MRNTTKGGSKLNQMEAPSLLSFEEWEMRNECWKRVGGELQIGLTAMYIHTQINNDAESKARIRYWSWSWIRDQHLLQAVRRKVFAQRSKFVLCAVDEEHDDKNEYEYEN